MDDRAPLGARIKHFRTKARLSQRELAERAGLSIDVVRKLEQGTRQTASITSLQALARALDVTIAELLDKVTQVADADPDSGVVAMRRVLTSVDDLLDPVTDTAEPLGLTEVSRETTFAWGAYWGGRYAHLTSLLPQAIVRARAVEAGGSAADHEHATDLLSQLYQIAGCTLIHLGQPDAAWLALQLARGAADRGHDQLRAATMRGTVAWYLLTQGRYDEAHRLAERAAESVSTSGDVPLSQLSVHGSLLLTAATSAGRNLRPGTAADLLTEAGEVAGRIGADRNDYESAFGLSQVIMQTTDVQVVTGQFGDALKTARRMPRDNGLPLAARSRHLADVAFSQAHLGRYEKAADTLYAMEATASDWLQHQTLPRQTYELLLRHERPTKLRELGARMNWRAQ